MDDIERIRTEYNRLDLLTGIDTRAVEIIISKRLSKKLGYFSIQHESLFSRKLSIVISKKAFKNDELLLDVIRHEYAHALVYLRHPLEKHGHDKVWKSACKEVGCNPKATVDYYKYVPVRELDYKYNVVCNACHSESKYKRNSQVVQIARADIPGKIICRKCRGTQFTVLDLVGDKND